MLTCPYDNQQFGQFAGLSAHMRALHPENWKGSIDSSLPEGRDIASLGQPEPPSARMIAGRGKGGRKRKVTVEVERWPTVEDARRGARLGPKPKVRAWVGRGQRKPEIHNKCPWCTERFTHPPAFANHIKGNHPNKWRGSVTASINGTGPVVSTGRFGKPGRRLTAAERLQHK